MPQAAHEEWVFGYGSLMWKPGFAFAEAHRARLTGYHRAFCIYSVHYRGSPRRPGLVLGLDRGGTCEGLAFRLSPADAAATLGYLRQRELIYGVYREALVPLELLDPGRPAVLARTYIAERAHPAYAARLPLATQVGLIRGALGAAGANLDYLANTVQHLRELGIREPGLERLLAAASAFVARGASAGEGRPRAVSLAKAWAAHTMATPRIARDRRFGYRRRLGERASGG